MYNGDIIKDFHNIVDFLASVGFTVEDVDDQWGAILTKHIDGLEMRYMVGIPHEGNEFTWLFRANAAQTFDRWGVADYQWYYRDPADFKANWNKYLMSQEEAIEQEIFDEYHEDYQAYASKNFIPPIRRIKELFEV